MNYVRNLCRVLWIIVGGSQKENKSIHPGADAENMNVNTSEGRESIQEHNTGESIGFVEGGVGGVSISM